jgi:hypothetical protein
MAATSTINKPSEDLKAIEDEKKVEVDRLYAAWGKARQIVDGLAVEQASLPGRKIETISAGDALAYGEVVARESFLPSEITIARIAAAKAAVSYWTEYRAWGKAHRDVCREAAERLGEAAGWPSGRAAGDEADNAALNSQAIAASSGLGESLKNLDALIETATRSVR